MEENINKLHSLSALRSLEVIDINTGTRLGYIKDVVINIQEKKVESLLLPIAQRRMFVKAEDYELPWSKVVKAGVDVILIDGAEFLEKLERNNL